MKVLVSLLAVVFALGATPAQVAVPVAQDGYFIEAGADATPDVVGEAVSEARFDGGALSVVVLSAEPPSGATTFADGVLDNLPSGAGTILVVGPESVGWASAGDTWTNRQLDAALDVALSGTTSNDVVTRFVGALLDPPSSGSSGLWLFLGFGIVVAGAFALFSAGASRRQRTRAAGQVEKLRAAAQLQIDAIANDILDFEDEVRLSDNAEAQEAFAAAVDTYTDASDRLGAMTSGRAIVELDTELDLAVWRLDSVEAILDGKPLPEKPSPPPYASLLDASPTPQVRESAGTGSAVSQYQRRSQRRSSYGAGDLIGILLATQGMRTIGRTRGGYARSRGQTRQRIPRMRGGGRRRG